MVAAYCPWSEGEWWLSIALGVKEGGVGAVYCPWSEGRGVVAALWYSLVLGAVHCLRITSGERIRQ